MRKYKTARFLAWLVIVGGLSSAVIFSTFGFFQLQSILGKAYFGPAFGLAFAGVFSALVGFGFLAFFDIAETITSGRQGSV
jgi:hypothetical protein